MDTKNTIYSAMMVISALVLTVEWLRWLENDNPVIYVSAMVLVGSLAAMIIDIAARITEINFKIDRKEQSLRINIQGVEENMERKLDTMISENKASIQEITGRLYR
ncbi:MAG: hypothetical protein KAT13_02855 [Methanosarcinales archaeon]|nr:hypothetical protein [Methanosarcinales archaeon]MCK4652010.1 hypothetical protein [Methanosarcinales archaeon]